jgi:hypothetical protein
MNTLIETTTNETNLIHWAVVDGVKYGIYDTFECNTLMLLNDDGTTCKIDDNPDSYWVVADAIKALVEAAE